jgi:hypothetical protein
MISDIDNALRELLQQKLPMRKGEVDISFDHPKREWSARLSKPTINLFLYDVRENIELRGSQQVTRRDIDDNRVMLRYTPVRIDLCYIVTGWAKEVRDEHRLLSEALMVFLRNPIVPEELLPENLTNADLPVRAKAAQANALHEISELWNTLDNEIHPSLRLIITIALEPLEPIIAPSVRTTELGFWQNPSPDAIAAAPADKPPQPVAAGSSYMVNGKINSQKHSLAVLKLVLSETGKEIAIQEDGGFKITRLRAGEYHLDVMANDRLLKHHKFQVPSASYEIQV